MRHNIHGKAHKTKAITLRVALACCGSMTALCAASAQQVPAASGASAAAEATSDPAQVSSSAVAPEDILRELVVTAKRAVGGGNMIAQREPLAVSSVSAKAIAERMSLSGPLQIIATLPGIATGQSDPFAMAQRSFVYIRGLPSNEQGWILEDIPVVDQAFFLPYSETFVDPENLAGITVIPGSSRITDPVQTAVGGEIIATVRQPSEELGGFVAYSHGSYKTDRIFGRLETGVIGESGLKAFASGSYTRAGTFNLPGTGDRVHADAKITKEWGDKATSTLFVSYTDWNSMRSNVISLAQFNAAKAADDYTIGNYAGTFVPGVTTNYYKLNYYQRKNLIVSFKNEIRFSDRLTLTVVPYYHWTKSNSPGQTSVNPASVFNGTSRVQINTTGLFLVNGQIPAMSNSFQDHYAIGANTWLTYDVTDSNRLLVGYWHDYFDIDAINNLTPVAQDGSVSSVWANDALRSTDGNVIAGLNYKFSSKIDAISIGDQQKLLNDRLTLEVGLKYFRKSLRGTNLAPGPQTDFGSTFHRFLPRASFAFDVTPTMQIYGNIVKSLRSPFTIQLYPNTYNFGTGRVAQLGRSDKGPETGLGQEFGYRYHDNLVTFDVAFFNKTIKNRQISASAILNGAGVSTVLVAGTQKTRGVTAELGFAPIYGFSPYVNGQYLDAKTKSNFATGGDFLPTAGKVAPASPKWTATAGLNYRTGSLFANALWKYNGSQFSTLMNDQKIKSYSTVDLGIGYELPEFWGQKAAVKFNITNVGNKPFLSAISATQPNAVATRGVNGTLIAAGTPTYTLASPRAFMVSLSSEF
ncbi:TonB-dependent receptor [Sphingomonas crocodyli]|nr:TonB-dependent receptor [Sphingomonas crocodyli]